MSKREHLEKLIDELWAVEHSNLFDEKTREALRADIFKEIRETIRADDSAEFCASGRW